MKAQDFAKELTTILSPDQDISYIFQYNLLGHHLWPGRKIGNYPYLIKIQEEKEEEEAIVWYGNKELTRLLSIKKGKGIIDRLTPEEGIEQLRRITQPSSKKLEMEGFTSFLEDTIPLIEQREKSKPLANLEYEIYFMGKEQPKPFNLGFTLNLRRHISATFYQVYYDPKRMTLMPNSEIREKSNSQVLKRLKEVLYSP
jgi:hypothetical protein